MCCQHQMRILITKFAKWFGGRSPGKRLEFGICGEGKLDSCGVCKVGNWRVGQFGSSEFVELVSLGVGFVRGLRKRIRSEFVN